MSTDQPGRTGTMTPYGRANPDDQLDPDWITADWYRDGELRRRKQASSRQRRLSRFWTEYRWWRKQGWGPVRALRMAWSVST